jgi:hypothetical protein
MNARDLSNHPEDAQNPDQDNHEDHNIEQAFDTSRHGYERINQPHHQTDNYENQYDIYQSHAKLHPFSQNRFALIP